MQIINDYLDQFHKDQKNIEEYKIKVLKNYYYPEVNKILNCKFKNFKIGVNSNTDIIFFYNVENPLVEVIYNIRTLDYKLRVKTDNTYKNIDIDINNYNKRSPVEKKAKKNICLNICLIQ